MQIRVKPELLAELSGQLKVQGEEFQSCIGAMESIIGRLPEAWEGAAANAYEGQFGELKPGFDQTRQLIEDISIQITQVIEAVQNMDNEISSKMK